MLFILFKLLHLLAIIIWVGGMFFAHFFLRPAVQGLQPPERVMLMHGVLQRFFAWVMVLVVVVLAIAAFNYYISVAQDLSFRHRFGEMAAISLGVAVLSFGIGLLVKQFLGISL